MLALLRGVVLRVVAITMAVVVLPLLAMLVWWGSSGSWSDGPGGTITPLQSIGLLLSLALVTSSVAVVAGFVHVHRVTDLVLPALAGIVAQTERVEEGVKARPIATTGVAEIDALSAAMTRGTRVAAKRLAAERDFAADASHQLRTPLTALLMRLEEIASTRDLAVVEEECHIAIAQVERLSGVVDDLLARSRSGSEGASSISLDSVLASLQREWQPAFAAARRTIRVSGDRGLRVHSEPGTLAQIFSTLFENSLAHGAGTTTVAARRSGPSVVIEVFDEGEGISPALAPHVFERSVSSSGSGLGLAVARDLAASHGGRLELVSTAGARFALFLSGGGQ